MVFSTGYQANLGLMSALAGQAAITSCSTPTATRRFTMAARWAMPTSYGSSTTTSPIWKSGSGRIPDGAGTLVVLEGVYSMMGDIAPLKDMVAVAKAAGAMIAVDEAHAMGFFGENGRGVFEAAGVDGRYRFRRRHLFEIGRNGRRLHRVEPSEVRGAAPTCRRPYVYTASLPPAVVACAATSIRKLKYRARQARASVGGEPPPTSAS